MSENDSVIRNLVSIQESHRNDCKRDRKELETSPPNIYLNKWEQLQIGVSKKDETWKSIINFKNMKFIIRNSGYAGAFILGSFIDACVVACRKPWVLIAANSIATSVN